MTGGWTETVLFFNVDQATYDRFWTQKSIGCLLPAAYHVGNIDVFSAPTLRHDFALPESSQHSTEPYQIGAFVPPPVPQAGRGYGFIVCTREGTQTSLAIPDIPDERIEELLPQFRQMTMEQVINYAREVTRKEEGVRAATFSYTQTLSHEFEVTSTQFYHQTDQLLQETTRLQAELDRVRQQSQDPGLSRRRRSSSATSDASSRSSTGRGAARSRPRRH